MEVVCSESRGLNWWEKVSLGSVIVSKEKLLLLNYLFCRDRWCTAGKKQTKGKDKRYFIEDSRRSQFNPNWEIITLNNWHKNQTKMRSIKVLHTIVYPCLPKQHKEYKYLAIAGWDTDIKHYLCVMAASQPMDQLFLLCWNCEGLSSCVGHKAGLGRLTHDQKHKQDYRSLTFHKVTTKLNGLLVWSRQ